MTTCGGAKPCRLSRAQGYGTVQNQLTSVYYSSQWPPAVGQSHVGWVERRATVRYKTSLLRCITSSQWPPAVGQSHAGWVERRATVRYKTSLLRCITSSQWPPAVGQNHAG